MKSRKQTYGSTKAHSEQRPTELSRVHADTLSQPQTQPAAAIQKSKLNPSLLTTDDILQLQRIIGNQKVVRLLEKEEQSNDGSSLEQKASEIGEKLIIDRKMNTAIQNKYPFLRRQSMGDVPNNSVIQRTILINGKTYQAGDEGLFDAEQNEHIEGVKRSLANAEFAKAPKTITEALQDKRTIEIKITKSTLSDKLFYEADTKDAYVKVEEGKSSREAGEFPVSIERPKQGVENISIAGLIMCIGVVIEVVDKYGKVAGAAGGHFLTPKMYIKEELQLRGMRFIHTISQLVDAQEGTKRFSLHYSGDADESTELAIKLLVAIFESKGYTNRGAVQGKGQITYSLNAQGLSSIT